MRVLRGRHGEADHGYAGDPIHCRPDRDRHGSNSGPEYDDHHEGKPGSQAERIRHMAGIGNGIKTIKKNDQHGGTAHAFYFLCDRDPCLSSNPVLPREE